MNPLPQDPLTLMSLTGALCSELGLHTQALSILGQLAAVRDRVPDALVTLALALSRSGDAEGAQQALREALTRDAQHEMARVLLAIHLHEAGDPQARGWLQPVLERGQDAEALALARSLCDEPSTHGASTTQAAARSSRLRYTRPSAAGEAP